MGLSPFQPEQERGWVPPEASGQDREQHGGEGEEEEDGHRFSAAVAGLPPVGEE